MPPNSLSPAQEYGLCTLHVLYGLGNRQGCSFAFNALIPCIPFSRLAGEGDDDIHFTYIKNLAFLFVKQSDHLDLLLSRHPGEGCRASRDGVRERREMPIS